MRVAMIGTGYVGLVTGACLADAGNHVVCVDINEEKVRMMKDGKVPIYEPHLDVLFERFATLGRDDVGSALEQALDTSVMLIPKPLERAAVGGELFSHRERHR